MLSVNVHKAIYLFQYINLLKKAIKFYILCMRVAHKQIIHMFL